MADDPNQDEIIREVRALRDAYAARFGYDVGALVRDARERRTGRAVVALEPKRIPAETRPPRTSA